MDTQKLQIGFFIGLLISVVVLTVFLFVPFLAPIALAFMAAIVMRPVNRWFLVKTSGKKTLAASLSVVFAIVVVLVPLTIVAQQVTSETYKFYTEVRNEGLGGFDRVTAAIIEPIQSAFPEFNPDVDGYISSLAGKFADNASKIFSSTASLTLSLFLAFMALFYMLRDGHRFREVLIELSPLADSYDNEIIDKIERAVNSVVRGSLLTAVIKGIFAAAGFAIFGVPHAILWGALTAVVSLVPLLGAGITVIPAVLYLIATDSIGAAIGLAIWGTVAVGLVDNLLMPIVVGKATVIHPLLILLSVLGGVVLFGPVGLFLGPLVIALLSALLEIYKVVILHGQNKQKTVL
ncbi:MAG: AI-2E family transporter [bacterium]|nr:AI-2E family transporter [bacterium]